MGEENMDFFKYSSFHTEL